MQGTHCPTAQMQSDRERERERVCGWDRTGQTLCPHVTRTALLSHHVFVMSAQSISSLVHRKTSL